VVEVFAMNNQDVSHSHSIWHVSAWPGVIAHMVHRSTKDQSEQVPAHLTRRQMLLAAQDLQRRERREQLLEQLRYIKPRGRGTS
jgi:hypothetical protein